MNHVSGEVLNLTDEELPVLAEELLNFGEDLFLALLFRHLFQYDYFHSILNLFLLII